MKAPRTATRAALAAAGILAVGCGQNAALELTIDLPPADFADPCGPRFAAVQPRASDNPFAEEWPAGDLPSIELGSAPIEDRVSVLATDTGMDVHLKVRFCRSSSCTSLGMDCPIGDESSPEVWYLLEHPFYEGERTSFHIDIPAIPAGRPGAPEIVDRCEIEGCLTGTSVTFCTSDGRHVCED